MSLATPLATPLATRNYRLLLAHSVSTRTILFIPYLYYFITEIRGQSAFEFGLITSVYYFGIVLLEVPSGVAADRLGRKLTLVVSAVANLLACVAFALADTIWIFAIGNLFFAVSSAMASGADSALLYDSCEADGRPDEYIRLEGGYQASWLLSSAVGLPLADLFLVRGADPTLALWATAALSVVGVLSTLAVREPPVAQRLSIREITGGAARDVAHIPGLHRLIVYSVAVFVLLRLAITVYYNPVLERLDVPIHTWGTLLAGINLVGGLAAWRAHALIGRFGERAVFFSMPLVLVGMYAVVALVQAPAVVGLFVAQSVVLGIHPVLVRGRLNRLVDNAARRATTISVESLACRAVYGGVTVAVGWALGVYGLTWAIGVGIALALVPLATLPWLRRAN